MARNNFITDDPVAAERLLDAFVKAGDKDNVERVRRLLTEPFYTFRPRPDDPANKDEQTSAIESKAKVVVILGGNASGKTTVAAHRVARFVLEEQQPPRKNTPFWIISDTYDQSCGVCWEEKLSNIIPRDAINWDGIVWHTARRGWPISVPLKPWRYGPPGTNENNWTFEFKSYEQGREKMQARSIGGFWFSEQAPWDIFIEVLRGCRDYMYDGAQIVEFCPIDPARSGEFQVIYEKWLAGDKNYAKWQFYRMSTIKAMEAGHVERDWFDAFFGSVSDEMTPTRATGEFAGYEGLIYPSFAHRFHAKPHVNINGAVMFRRGIDWGASHEHPFVCLWMCKDGTGQWRVYDEYRCTDQVPVDTHIREILRRQPWPRGDSRFGCTWADPSRPDNIAAFNAAGINVMPADNSFYTGRETVLSLLKVNYVTGEPNLVFDAGRCVSVIGEFSRYRWLKSSGKGLNPAVARPEPLKNDDHGPDAVRYVVHSEAITTGGTPDSMMAERTKRESIRHKTSVVGESSTPSRNGVRLERNGKPQTGRR